MGTCTMQATIAAVILFSRGSAQVRDMQIKGLVAMGMFGA